MDTSKAETGSSQTINLGSSANATLGVVGESGCGKSTLGRCIIHLLDTTDGKIFFEGRDITNIRKEDLKESRKDMQMIFQDPFSSINPRMTVKSIIMEPHMGIQIRNGTKKSLCIRMAGMIVNLLQTAVLHRRGLAEAE